MLSQLPEQLIIRIFAYSRNNEFRLVSKVIFKSTNSLENNGEYLLARLGNKDIFKVSQGVFLNENLFNESNILNALSLAVFDIDSYNNIFHYAIKKNWLKVVNKLINSFRLGSNIVDIWSYFEFMNNKEMILECIVDINVENGKNLVSAIENKSFAVLPVLLKAHKLTDYIKQRTNVQITLKMHEKVDSSRLNEEHIDILFESKQTECIELLVSESIKLLLLDQLLLKGVVYGATGVVKETLRSGVDIENNGYDLLKHATKNGHVGIIKLLINKGVDIHTDDDWDLRRASFRGHLELVKYFVENGADIHAENECALRWACSKGHLDIVKFLVGRGADVQADDNRALRNALRYGQIETMRYLLNNGSDINLNFNQEIKYALNNRRYEAVAYAFERGVIYCDEKHDQIKQALRDENYILARYFVRGNFDENTNQCQFDRACRKNDLKMVRYLVENVMKDSSRNEFGFKVSIKNGSLEVCQYFIERGLNINDFKEGIKLACESGSLDILKLIIDLGADIEENKIVALSSACFNENGVDLNYHGEKVLISAIENYQLDTVQFLVEQGVEMEAEKESLLIDVCKYGSLFLIETLVDLGVDIHCEDGIALRTAIEHADMELVEYLVERGADLHTNIDLLLKIASATGNLDIVKLLVENGADINAKCENLPLSGFSVSKIKLSEMPGLHGHIFIDFLSYYCNSKLYKIKHFMFRNEEKSVSIDLRSNTPLCIACICEDTDIIDYLLEKGADIHANNDKALMWAKFIGSRYLTELFLTAGANDSVDTNSVFVIKLKTESVTIYDLFTEDHV
ncbi:hypothetical protein BB560_003139 [Smittium megazygosporum]|uniref:F-box domain-containing protein n=1 Tax=Smittium megazygosporum TaxID=133381 RepID=A0A2T9ZCT7_9FUNG|nr:hypothetical protein BB560_005413 [Smittium megazygosporum]PVV02408.1 hypothetical protein BB560_003139 [Smittium megazygosporum]